MRVNQTRAYKGAGFGLAAAGLFGVGLPLAKLLLPEANPVLLAGLLYLGAGLGLLAFERLFYRGSVASRREAQVAPADRWLLAGIVLTGGILGPVFMLWGLQRMTGVLGSLLLNLEAPFTILLAVVFFHEHLGRLEAVGAMLIVMAAGLLQYKPGSIRPDVWGVVAISCACLSWALDNNLSQRLSLRDPIVVTRIKALSAGGCTLIIATVVEQNLPRLSIMAAALVLGLFSYGVSLVLDMHALRLHGAAREAGYFATAPFIGAVAAVPILGDHWGVNEAVATVVMGMGVLLLVRARHRHFHIHEAVGHEHTHVHDDHHDHGHAATQGIEEPHSHPHRHLPLSHDHPHVSELHHRHEHG